MPSSFLFLFCHVSPFAHSTYALTLELVMDAEAAGGRQRREWSRSRPCSNSALVQANVIKRQITNVKVNCRVRDAEGLPQISPPFSFSGIKEGACGKRSSCDKQLPAGFTGELCGPSAPCCALLQRSSFPFQTTGLFNLGPTAGSGFAMGCGLGKNREFFLK